MASPVHVGEEYDVTIETVGSKGDGVAKIKGYVVFIPKVSEGAKLRIRVTKTLDKVGFGEVVASNPAEPEEAKEETENSNQKDEESKSGKKDIDVSGLNLPKFSKNKKDEDKKADLPDLDDDFEDEPEHTDDSDEDEADEAPDA